MLHNYVYDIDGTITKEGYDLWYLTSLALARDKGEFEKNINDWKTSKEDLYSRSLKMMNLAVAGFSSNNIEEEVLKIIFDIGFNNLIRPGALEQISRDIEKGRVCFSTTNYSQGAQVLSRLIEEHLGLNPGLIKVKGSIIDLNERRVISLNLGPEKILGIEGVIAQAYGDDPLGNDQAMMEAANRAYIINTLKNKEVSLYDRLYW